MTGTKNKAHVPGSTTQGVLLLTSAQGLLVAFGCVVHLIGTRVLTQGEYGRFVTALSFSYWLHAATGALILPGLCKIVSEDHRRLRAALATAAKWHWGTAAAACAALALAAKPLAALFGDSALAPLFLVTALDVLLFAGAAVGQQLLSALRHFKGAAAALSVYALVRATAASCLLLAGFGAVAATAGFAAGSLAGALVGIALLLAMRRRLAEEPYPPMLRRSVRWGAMTLPTNLGVMTLATLDIWFVKALVADPAVAGLYGAAFVASRLPAVLVQGLLGATFPRISQALADGDADAARAVARQAMRCVIVVFAPVCVIVATESRAIMALLFGPDYGEAHHLLTLLVFALALMSMLRLMLRLLAAADRPGRRMLFVLSLLPPAIVLNIVLTRRLGAAGAAWASLIVMLAGVLIGVVLVRRTLGALPPLLTLLRCALAAGAVYALGALWRTTGPLVSVEATTLTAAYIALLLLLRELRAGDMPRRGRAPNDPHTRSGV